MNTGRKKRVLYSGWAWLLNLTLLVALALGPLALPGAQAAPTLSAGYARSAGLVAMPDHLPAAAMSPTNWTFQGPAPHLAGQQDLLNDADEPVSGAVRVIAASPTNADLVYLAGSNGGVWKSTNASATSPTWTPLTDNLMSQSIGDMSLDPTDPTGQTLVVGTGRFSAFGKRGDDLAGLYYTADGGTTWTTTTGTGNNLSASDIRGVAARGSTLLATSATGVFITTGGPTGAWTNIRNSRGLPDAPALDLVGDPNNTNRFYVTFGGASGGIFKTEDLGATWTNVTSGISGISSDTAQFNVAVFNSGTTNVVSVILNGTVGGVAKNLVYRSVNGAAFTALDTPAGDFSTSYDFGISADKTNPNLVYVAGYGCLSPSPYRPVVYRLDASQALGSQATLLSTPNIYGTPHPDVNVLAIDANGSLWMGVHGGVFRLPAPANAASGTNYWVSKNGNLGVSEIHSIAYDRVSHVLIAGIQDNGVGFQSAQGNQVWSMAPSQAGDGGDVAVADIGGGQSVRFGSSQSLGSFRRYVYNASNDLVSSASIGHSVVTDPQFVTPLAVNAVDPQRLLMGGSNHLYESLNQGGTITALAQVVGANRPSAIAYGGRRGGVANPDVLYVGFGSQVYARTAAGGAVGATAALPAGAGTIADVVMNPADWMNVFAIDDNQVFATTDGGATWTDITGSLVSSGLSSTTFTAIEFVAGPAPYIALGSRSGVFASLLSNLGTWVELGDSLPDVPVFELAYDAVDDVLAAATLGRAAWLLPNASSAFVPSNVAPVLALSGPTTANEGSTNYSYSFTVTDPGDRFTVSTLTVGAGGTLVPGSLTTTATGGSFKVNFPDGPASPTITLQVTDSTGLLSNTATTTVTVSNVAPSRSILGAPTSGSVGTPINLTSSVTDPSAADTAAGFTYDWLVQKTVGTTVTNFATGSAASFSYTPDVAASYKVYFRAKDKDGLWSGYTAKTITAASPDLTENAVSVTVSEGMTAMNSGTYAHHGPAPLTISASVGTVEQTQTLFADNFDSEPQAYETITLSQWNVTQNNVDVIGTGFNDFYPGNGNYLDMDGSASATIQSKRVFNLVPGTYQLSFEIGTNPDGPTNNSLHVTLGAAFDESFAAPTALTPVVRQFTVSSAVSAPLIFEETGPSDAWGSILDGVKLVWLDASFTHPALLNVRGYWQLGEDDAGAADGVTGNDPTLGQDGSGLNPALNLSRNGSPSYTSVDGSNGSVLAMSLNGSTDAYVLANPVTTATDNFGIEAWVRFDSVSGNQVIVYNGNSSLTGFGLHILGGTYRGLYGGNVEIDTGVAAATDGWHDIALVRNNGVTQIYMDGTLIYNNNVGGPNPATAGFAVGQTPQAAIDFLNGAVDDARVFTFSPGTFSPQDLLINTSVSGTWSWSYSTDDGPAQDQDVTITASTGVSGDTTSLPFPLVVDNVAPTATFGNGGAVSEGSTGTVSFSGQLDLSMADTAAGFRYAYDFDNDGVFEVGDGTYAGSDTAASATVPASFLAEGPGSRTVLARILDKDDGYTDYSTTIVIDNAAPTASVSGPADALVGQVVTFVFEATDTSSADQAAGFTYSINWGDGSPLQTIAQSAGNGAAAASHAYAATGNYTVQVTATDKDGAVSPASGSTAITVNALDASSLQALIATTPIVYLAPADDAGLQSAMAAINGLAAPASPVDITIVLGAGPYSGVTLSRPSGIVLDLAGNDTIDSVGTQIAGNSGPAVTVTSGEVFVQGDGLTTSADAPTVLVTGGHLTVRQNNIQESTGFNNVAVEVTGGSVDLGFDMLMNINGEGGFFRSYDPDAVGFPEGVDADMVPNTYAVNGVPVSATKLSATSLTSSPAPSGFGQNVTFTATIDVEADEQGPATGTVTFYDGAAVLGTGTVSKVGDEFLATFTTNSLGVGTHTIAAVYGGNDVYVASSALLTQMVVPVADAGGPYLGAINTPIQFDGSGSDPNSDPLTYAWDFGDGSTGTGAMLTHSYSAAGIYDVCLTVSDGQFDSAPSCTMAVVYDPNGGFVTGGGWINSPAGAYPADPSLTGKASFGFVSKYKKGASVPEGSTEFQFQAGGLNFHSETYEWLVVNQGGTNAQFKGSGTINGALDPNGNAYKFMLWAGDSSPDTFRIKIWSEANGGETVVYDNGTDQAIGGGNIVVHKGK